MDPLQPGDPGQVGSYALLGRLGAGGMGQVFLGRSPGGRPVAVKLIRPEHADSGQFRSRFAREVQAAKRVSGFHTALVVDADPDADPPWMVTAFIPGPSLRDAVADHGPLPVDVVRALGAGLAEGLAAIHACGMAHRDLKPGNVILAADGPRIIDFGLARTLDSSAITETGAVLGTYAYMSPEQVRGQPATQASDVFSLGCVLAFAATSHSPFDAGSIATIVHRIISEPPDLHQVPDGPGLRGLISACLAKNSAGRPGLSEIIAQLSVPAPRNAWPPPAIAARITARTPGAAFAAIAGESGTTFPSAFDGVPPELTYREPGAGSAERTDPSHLPGGRVTARAGRTGAARAPTAGGNELAEAAAQLAVAVGAQWREEQERRRLHDPIPLPVRWHPAAPQLVDHWANIRCAPAGASPGPLAVTGRLERIADVYRQLPSGRLVVLGQAGAGKTVVALRFVLDMIATRGAADPVPVLFSVGPWNPATASLRSWLTHQLEREYPALAVRGPASSLAAGLVGAGLILPVLDGFDEIADGLHGAALRALNATTLALLLTSLPGQYAAAVTSTDVLTAAAGIELDDLSLDDLNDYLPRTTRPAFPGGKLTTVWDPVLAHLRDQPGDPASETLRKVLSTPLMVSLARTVYSDTPGHDPADLLDAERFPAAAALQDHLLDAFTPAAYQDPFHDYPGHRDPEWDATQAQRWLSCIAWQLDRLGTRDLAVWQLSASRSRVTCGLSAAAVSTLVFGLAGWLAGGGPAAGSRYALTYALVNGLLFGLAWRSRLRAWHAAGALTCAVPVSRGGRTLPCPAGGRVRRRRGFRPRRRARGQRHRHIRPGLRAGPRITRLAAPADHHRRRAEPPRGATARPRRHADVWARGGARLRHGRRADRRVFRQSRGQDPEQTHGHRHHRGAELGRRRADRGPFLRARRRDLLRLGGHDRGRAGRWPRAHKRPRCRPVLRDNFRLRHRGDNYSAAGMGQVFGQPDVPGAAWPPPLAAHGLPRRRAPPRRAAPIGRGIPVPPRAAATPPRAAAPQAASEKIVTCACCRGCATACSRSGCVAPGATPRDPPAVRDCRIRASRSGALDPAGLFRWVGGRLGACRVPGGGLAWRGRAGGGAGVRCAGLAGGRAGAGGRVRVSGPAPRLIGDADECAAVERSRRSVSQGMRLIFPYSGISMIWASCQRSALKSLPDQERLACREVPFVPSAARRACQGGRRG